MNLKTAMVLLAGTGVMMVLILILMKHYRVNLWKSIPVAFILTITGTLGTYVWYFVENSDFTGRSYYGAVFLVPLAFIYVAKLIRIPYKELLDFCAPAECVMLAIMKFQCYVEGCCVGRVINTLADGTQVLFPSQIVEFVNALVIMATLMCMAHMKRFYGKVYGWYLVIYGSTRFALNFFRGETVPVFAGLPAGQVWSLVAVFVGFIWITERKIMIVKKDIV